MFISTGRVRASEPWKILEVAMGQAADVLAIRLSRQLKRIREPIEVLIPTKRTPVGELDWLIEHVYIRGANGSLRMLANTPGIDCIRKEAVETQWITQLLAQEREAEAQRLSLGAFVRVLAGPCTRMCGTISALNCTAATVKIKMFTKTVTAHIHQSNLQIVECPPEHQVFYYQPELFS